MPLLLHQHQIRLRLFLSTATRRRRQIYIYILTLITLFVFLKLFGVKTYVYPRSLVDFWEGGKIMWEGAPEYGGLYEWEDGLPQHQRVNLEGKGKEVRYVKFSNQIEQLGWNNVFNEVLMNTYLAYASNRAYVFQDYTWKSEYHPWLIPFITFSSTRRHPRTPLTALISGPSAGGPWDAGDPAPRAVSSRYFDLVCPPNERFLIHTRDIKPALINASAVETFETWRKVLSGGDEKERCVEVLPAPLDEDPYPQTFDLMMFGTPRVVGIWEAFVGSPVSRLLDASLIVKRAVAFNLDLGLFGDVGGHPEEGERKDPLSTTLAMHLRLGDFSDACVNNLAAGNWTFYSWNNLPFLAGEDRFVPPPGGEGSPGHPGWNSEENISTYLERCQPSVERVLGVVEGAKKEWEEGGNGKEERKLDMVFILTNEKNEVLGRLIEEFYRRGWKKVLTSDDIVFPDEVGEREKTRRGWSWSWGDWEFPFISFSSRDPPPSPALPPTPSSSSSPSFPSSSSSNFPPSQHGWSRSVSGSIDMEIARRSAVFIGNGWSSFTSNIVHQRLASGKEPRTCRFW